MPARTRIVGDRQLRRRLIGASCLLAALLAGTGLWWGLHRTAPTPAPLTAGHTAPPPRVTHDPLPSDRSLATAAPSRVPAAVVADMPQLPAHLPPVGLGQVSAYSDKVSARLVSITPVDATARRRGEISGPALAVAVELSNSGSSPVSLESVSVNAYSGPEATPAIRLLDGATQPLHGTLSAGRSMTATYVFSVPRAQRDQLTVTVSLGAGRDGATAVFSGSAA